MSARPTMTAEQDRQLMLRWVREIRSEIAGHHDAQPKLAALEARLCLPPFPVARSPLDASAELDSSAWTLALAGAGAALFSTAGFALAHNAPAWAIAADLIGALALSLSFDRAE